ncbi:Hypothetical predicted protein [Paramuricea clavata]|uniref:Uncharacterized protein n=1 Tax=Paramuricea clavata TaxID=317549 RepID=A0A6S7LR30_PARCT|nr:Hypothetical predicted protein [Paramuricea clavata]
MAAIHIQQLKEKISKEKQLQIHSSSESECSGSDNNLSSSDSELDARDIIASKDKEIKKLKRTINSTRDVSTLHNAFQDLKKTVLSLQRTVEENCVGTRPLSETKMPTTPVTQVKPERHLKKPVISSPVPQCETKAHSSPSNSSDSEVDKLSLLTNKSNKCISLPFHPSHKRTNGAVENQVDSQGFHLQFDAHAMEQRGVKHTFCHWAHFKCAQRQKAKAATFHGQREN